MSYISFPLHMKTLTLYDVKFVGKTCKVKIENINSEIPQ